MQRNTLLISIAFASKQGLTIGFSAVNRNETRAKAPDAVSWTAATKPTRYEQRLT